MIRLDLSEYQNPGSARRMLGDGELEDASLVARIRRQPFSVVLLDEFEKADPGVFDLFLQVFDDGRLSDPRGEPADFRHAVIIMTSNLGAKIVTGRAGLLADDRVRRRRACRQAVTRAFRPEFLNRIDRTVVFRPLSRAGDARDPGAELEAVLARRGLRARQWAVEFDDSALEFLLGRGLHAGPRRAAAQARGRAALPDAAGAGDRRPRLPGGRPVPVRARGRRRPEGHVRGPRRPDEPAAAPRRPSSLRTLAREGEGRSTLLEARVRGRRRRGSTTRLAGGQGGAAGAASASPASGTTTAASRCSAASSCATASRPGCAAPTR